MFLLGLVSSFVILSLPARENDFEKQIRIMTESIESYRQNAFISGQVIGLRFEGDGYQAMRWLDGSWQASAGKTSLLEDLSITMIDVVGETQPDLGDWPQIVFDPTGVAVDRKLFVSGAGVDFEVLIAATGEVSVDVL